MLKSFYEDDGRIEIVVSDKADWELFEELFSRIKKKFNIKLIKKLDGINERYWEFEDKDGLLCLHLQHHLGITIFPISDLSLNGKVKKIAEYLKSSK